MTAPSDDAPGDRDQTTEPTQDRPVVDTVLELATADSALSARQKLLVLASLDSGETLAAGIGADPGTAMTPPSPGVASAEVEAVGAFLSSITVSGFRGIGEPARLKLHPGPGLTVVAGRNGSGKSSFAEALEFALTGDSCRWAGKKASFWKDSWRNLHRTHPAALRIELAEEGSGRTEIGVEWQADAALEDHKVWTQRTGEKRTAGVDSLGWGTALDLYRPILSYDELGQRLEGTPTELYRSIEAILGLDRIADGITRLSDQHKRLKVPATNASDARRELKRLLDAASDGRAQSALVELRRYKPDLELLSKIATGTSAPDHLGDRLRTLSELSLPDDEDVERVARELLEGVENLASIGGTASDRAQARTALLERALTVHAEHGDQACPVCGVGVLDTAWRQRVTAQLEAEQADLAAVRSAQAGLAERRDAARRLVAGPELPDLDGEIGLSSLPDARAAVAIWRDAPASDVELAQHLASRAAAIIEKLSRLRSEATSLLSERDDSWRGLAQQIAAWVELKRSADAASADLGDVSAAYDWLKKNADTLRNRRLVPLADEARAIWAKLRQDSSIDLDTITLSGQRTRGKVNLKATVDGVPTEALPVMSQGELNAIALALFLPRATMTASPLRFVVLDDPVQAMDPAKVDGLTEVLVEYAKDRQVVVFTHDDRLAESVRRTAPQARIVQVERGPGSKVEVTESQSPARRYLDDAHDLLRDENVPADVLDNAIPAYARLAVEAAAHEVYFRTQLTAPNSNRREVETAWTKALKTSQRVALAVQGDVHTWRQRQPYRQKTLTLCSRDVHHGMSAGAKPALADVRKTIDDLLDGRR